MNCDATLRNDIKIFPKCGWDNEDSGDRPGYCDDDYFDDDDSDDTDLFYDDDDDDEDDE
jgi:hypothetical protein